MAETKPFALQPKDGMVVFTQTYATIEAARAAADELSLKHTKGIFIVKYIELRYADVTIENKSFPLSE